MRITYASMKLKRNSGVPYHFMWVPPSNQPVPRVYSSMVNIGAWKAGLDLSMPNEMTTLLFLPLSSLSPTFFQCKNYCTPWTPGASQLQAYELNYARGQAPSFSL